LVNYNSLISTNLIILNQYVVIRKNLSRRYTLTSKDPK